MTTPSVLVICGPTATGKTSFASRICPHINGEIISADSRQVYRSLDIVTGKDLPVGSQIIESDLVFNGRKLGYYLLNSVPVWLYDVVSPDEPFSVSSWRRVALQISRDIFSRGKTPVVVGGTGLYIKSLTASLSDIHIPANQDLRRRLSGKNASELLAHLRSLNPSRANSLNASDSKNPRRLIRAIELSQASSVSPASDHADTWNYFSLGLTAPKAFLSRQIEARVDARIAAGAFAESRKLIGKFGLSYPSMTASGYQCFGSPDWRSDWITAENQYVKRQLTWFKKQPGIHWFDISDPSWQDLAQSCVLDWYNKKSHDQKS